MGSKGTRNTIIALIILGIGIFIIREIASSFVQEPIDEFTGLADFLQGAQGIFDLSLYAIGGLVVLLIIVYIAQRRGERKRPAPAEYPEEEGGAPEAPEGGAPEAPPAGEEEV